jgi:hypothetical protein
MKTSFFIFLISFLIIINISFILAAEDDLTHSSNDSDNAKVNEIDNNIDNEHHDDDKKDPLNNEFAKKIVEDMKLSEKEFINKVEFREFLKRLITRDNPNKGNPHFYDGVLDKYMKTVPEEVKHSELMNYIDYTKFVGIIEEVIREQYGEQYVDVVKEALVKQETKQESYGNEEL